MAAEGVARAGLPAEADKLPEAVRPAPVDKAPDAERLLRVSLPAAADRLPDAARLEARLLEEEGPVPGPRPQRLRCSSREAKDTPTTWWHWGQVRGSGLPPLTCTCPSTHSISCVQSGPGIDQCTHTTAGADALMSSRTL